LFRDLEREEYLTVGATDAGLVYKFAGYLCLEPFNHLVQVVETRVFQLMYLAISYHSHLSCLIA
jgi:hypothetical protein